MIQTDEYFWDGLVQPPTSKGILFEEEGLLFLFQLKVGDNTFGQRMMAV